ncbi:MAG: hypothetical protein ACOC0Q_01460 [Wenzhouxiangella sp.]
MKKVIYINNTGARKTVAGMAVAAGESIQIDERDHPEFKAAPAQRPAKAPTDPVLELLDQPIAEIVEQLPSLTDEQFDQLQQAEKDGKTRKGLLKAFDEEYLRRAEAKVDAQKDTETSE